MASRTALFSCSRRMIASIALTLATRWPSPSSVVRTSSVGSALLM
jgi:hypothetical protein